MRTIFFILFAAVLSPAHLFAQTQQKLDIEHVTVFLRGAELYNTAKLNLTKGETEIIFTNIAGNINQQSISVGADNEVVIQSVAFQNNYLQTPVASARVKNLEDSIEILSNEYYVLNDKLTVINEQKAVLNENKKVAGQNTGLSVMELQKMLDLVNTKLTSLLSDSRLLTTTQTKINKRLDILRNQLAEEQNKTIQPGGQLLVKFYSPKATAVNIKLSYVVPDAGWNPAYDIRVGQINEPVQLFYKANVRQNSGVAWNNVQLTLSTGNPNESAQAPVLNPWYLAFYQPIPVTYNAGPNQLNIGAGRSVGESYSLDGVQVLSYKTPLVDKSVSNPTTLNNYVQVDNSGVNTTFDIDLPYTIPSDNKEQLVSVKKYELPASYRYYAVPKLDKDVFLQARITDWEDLNLLPAPTNIFYEGSFIGQGYIDMRNVKDTMNISLGRDKKIIIRREQDKKYRSVRTIGSNVRESVAFTITARNTRKTKVDIIILDQFPVSNDKDIVIEDKEAKDAVINEETGAVTWTLSLEPNLAKELQLKYTVKYPKGKTITNYK